MSSARVASRQPTPDHAGTYSRCSNRAGLVARLISRIMSAVLVNLARLDQYIGR